MHPAGFGLYRYRYLWSDTEDVGVLAQEVLEVMPHAVIRGDDGYLRVDYGVLGLSARMVSRREICAGKWGEGDV